MNRMTSLLAAGALTFGISGVAALPAHAETVNAKVGNTQLSVQSSTVLTSILDPNEDLLERIVGEDEPNGPKTFLGKVLDPAEDLLEGILGEEDQMVPATGVSAGPSDETDGGGNTADNGGRRHHNGGCSVELPRSMNNNGSGDASGSASGAAGGCWIGGGGGSASAQLPDFGHHH